MEAFDTHSNLKSAIFNHYKSELQWLCQTEEGKEPHLMIVFKVQDTTKIPVVVEVFSGLVESHFLHDVVEVDNEVAEVKPDFFATELGCSLVNHCSFCHRSDNLLGLAFMDSSGSVISVSKFSTNVSIDDLEALTFAQFKLHVILNADIEFIHTVLGLQSCSAKYPCCLCLIPLDALRKDRSEGGGNNLRSREQMQKHLENVSKGGSLAQKK